MTDNEIAKHFQSFCKELVEWIDGDEFKPAWVTTHSGLCFNFIRYAESKSNYDSLEPFYDWLYSLFKYNNLSPTVPFNIYRGQPPYGEESNKFTNPDRVAFIRKYANEFPEIN